MLKVCELFAGTGAFSLAFEKTERAQTIFANDIEKSSKLIYDLNFDIKLTLSDIHDLNVANLPAFDILTAGFPCQPFSIAGRKEGFDDPRSNVFWKMLEIIKAKKPACIILENVKNLCTHNSGQSFSVIRQSILDLNYSFDYKIFNTCELTDIPQNRERLYMVCFKDSTAAARFIWPETVQERRNFREFLEPNVLKKYYYTESSRIWPKLINSVTDKEAVYQYRRHYVRENKSRVCPTLTANMGTGGHNVPIILDSTNIRKLTPRECFSLQGFPPNYNIGAGQLSDGALYKLAGNAVSVSVVEKIAQAIIDALNTQLNNAKQI